MSEESLWTRAAAWVWSNWDDIEQRLGRLRGWFGRPGDPPKAGPGILVIGPGGAGKTTLAKLLSGEYTTRLFEEPWRYEESISRERYHLADDAGIEVVVPPGQASRRGSAWADVRADVAAGEYRGVIVVVSSGWLNLPGAESHRRHLLYEGNKAAFLAAWVDQKRAEERAALDHLRPALEAAPGKLWLLVVVTKQDLWWPDRAAAQACYRAAEWSGALDAIQGVRGVGRFRHETVGCSLVIANLRDGEGNLLRANAGGYDQERQVASLRRLLEVLDGLRA